MRLRCLTLVAFALVACRGESETRQHREDTIAPVGTGTERLLTEERLALLHEWIGIMARTGTVPRSIEDIEPPAHDAPRYVPVERYRRDGWGRTIHYEFRGEDRSYELRSPGDDAQLRTSDDITLRSVVRLP